MKTIKYVIDGAGSIKFVRIIAYTDGSIKTEVVKRIDFTKGVRS